MSLYDRQVRARQAKIVAARFKHRSVPPEFVYAVVGETVRKIPSASVVDLGDGEFIGRCVRTGQTVRYTADDVVSNPVVAPRRLRPIGDIRFANE